MVANTGMLTLSRDDTITYVAQNASRFGLDPAAVLAVANHEGLNRPPINNVGQTWVLPGEGGAYNFGPPSWQSAGAGKAVINMQGANAPTWAWTAPGLDYWLQQVANSGAAGKSGYDAIVQIVGGYGWGFERPKDPSADIIPASRDLPMFQRLVAQAQAGNPIVTTPDTPGNITIPGQPTPGGTQLPTPTNPQANPSTSAQAGAKFSMHLFDTPLGPIDFTLPWDFSGILLFLAAIFAIIIGALLWDKSRTAIKNTVQTGGEVAAVAAL